MRTVRIRAHPLGFRFDLRGWNPLRAIAIPIGIPIAIPAGCPFGSLERFAIIRETPPMEPSARSPVQPAVRDSGSACQSNPSPGSATERATGHPRGWWHESTGIPPAALRMDSRTVPGAFVPGVSRADGVNRHVRIVRVSRESNRPVARPQSATGIVNRKVHGAYRNPDQRA